MGRISAYSAPLIDLSNKELKKLQNRLKYGILTESTGMATENQNLTCLTAPTTAGFSGSPVVTEDAFGNWNVCGIFLGGPALAEHKKLVNLMTLYRTDKSAARKLLEDFRGCPYPLLNDSYRRLDRLFNDDHNFTNQVQSLYSSAILETRKNASRRLDSLNHNLCLNFRRISNFLMKNNIRIN